MDKNPKISVLLPVYNGEKYLAEAIESILAQSFVDFELLIINDGSTDNSEKIIKNYSDPRIVYIKNEKNIGLIGALNKGWHFARGKYIARMDQDDISLPGRFRKQVEFMDGNPDIGVCGSWIKMFGAGKEKIIKYPVDPETIKAEMLFLNPIAHPTVMARKSFFGENDLRYDENYKNAEDYELWARAVNFFKFYNLPEVLLKYRISPGQMTQKYQEPQNKMAMVIRKKMVSVFKEEISEEDVLLHESLGTYDSPETEDFIDRAAAWLLKIIKINEEKKIYSRRALARTAGKIYLNLLNKNIGLGKIVLKKLFFSALSGEIKIKDKIRFIIKYFIR